MSGNPVARPLAEEGGLKEVRCMTLSIRAGTN